MQFSIAPRELNLDVFNNPQQCVGSSCQTSYAISDVYFAEVCVINHVCKNKAELFALDVGSPFQCEFDAHAFLQLQSFLHR